MRAGLVPLIAAILAIPKIALLPLFVIGFGTDAASNYALIALATVTPMVLATYGGVDGVDRTLVRMGRSCGLAWWSVVTKAVRPGALPAILPDLKVALALAITLLVAAAMPGAQHGVGANVREAGSLYDLERLFAGVTLLSIIGVGANALIVRTERRLLAGRG